VHSYPSVGDLPLQGEPYQRYAVGVIGFDHRSGRWWPHGMPAESSHTPRSSGAEVRVPGTEVEGVAGAMSEA